MNMPATLKGFVNEQTERLYIEGSLPDFVYDGTQYESVSLTCNNPLDEFTCRLRGTMKMDSGAKLNFSLNTSYNLDASVGFIASTNDGLLPSFAFAYKVN